jgi:nitronate monooxygenase
MEKTETAFTKLLNITYPVVQAPMANFSGVELVSVISNAGGLGSLGSALMPPEKLRESIRAIKQKTKSPFAVNLFSYPHPHVSQKVLQNMQSFLNQYRKKLQLPLLDHVPEVQPLFEKQVEVLLSEKVPVFSFTFGIPSTDILQEIKKQGSIIIGTATSREEAKQLEIAGVQAIVAQGSEAGGHRGTFIEMPLQSALPTAFLVSHLQSETRLPIIAAGGIMNGKQGRAFMNLGASAVQLGTFFLSSHESLASEAYKSALKDWKNRPTVFSRAFTGRWARMIQNNFVSDLQDLSFAIHPYPYQGALTLDIRSVKHPELMPVYAGQGFSSCLFAPALDLFKQFVTELHENSK